MKKLLATMMMLAVVMGIHAQQTISAQEMSDRIQIRALVDNYALLSDQFKQENYNEVFHKDLKLRIHMGATSTRQLVPLISLSTKQDNRYSTLPTAPMPVDGFT